MKKLTMSLIGLAFVLCASSAQAQGIPCNNDADCPDDNLYCTGIESCAVGASICESGEAPCAGQLCDEDTDTCVDCLDNTDCDDGVYCNGIETCSVGSCVDGSSPCEVGVVCDEDNDTCVECVSDDNCTGDTPFCDASNQCVECLNNLDCPEDGDPCNGEEICSAGQCQSAGNPCGEQICIPLSIPVDQPAALAPSDYICVACDNDTQCDDGDFCNGEETCDNGTCTMPGDPCASNESAPVCDEIGDSCVECLVDDNCTDNATPFCFDNTCVECLGDANCDDYSFCNGPETCDNGSCLPFEGDVCERGELCDDELDRCVGCFDDGDCTGDNNTPRCDENLQCVQCLDELDCAEEELCREGSCVTAACELKIRPKKIRINKMFRPMERWIKITGEEGFDPYAEMDFGILQPNIRTAKVDKKGKLKVLVTVPSSARLYKGLVEIRVGDCVGYVELK